MSKLDQLRSMLSSGQFHHATYRDIGSLWEGLWVYEKRPDGFYAPALSFGKADPDLDAAHSLVRHTGVSLGAYGQG